MHGPVSVCGRERLEAPEGVASQHIKVVLAVGYHLVDGFCATGVEELAADVTMMMMMMIVGGWRGEG